MLHARDFDAELFETQAKVWLSQYAGSATTTYRGYASDMEDALAFLRRATKTQHPRCGDWNRGAVEAYLKWLADQGRAPSTIKRRFASLNAFFNFNKDRFFGLRNPCKGQAPSIPVSEPDMFESSELLALKDVIEQVEDEFSRARDLALVSVMYFEMLRISESVNLRMLNLLPNLSMLVKVQRKARRWQDIPMSPETAAAIRTYLPIREAFINEHYRIYRSRPEDVKRFYPLFVSSRPRGTRPEDFTISARTVRHRFSIYAQAAGVVDARPHRLRNTGINHFHAAQLDKCDPYLTSQAAGHSDPRTTMGYLVKPSAEIAKVLKKRKWGGHCG